MVLFLLIALQASAQGWRVYKSDNTKVDFPYEKMNSLVVYEASEHTAVDLGLPSGTKWATCNVGASSPEENGDYYAWGETVTKSVYDWSTYAPGGSTLSSENACGTSADLIYQQCGGKNADVSGTKYDVAFVKWGSKWKTPTNAQHRELVDNCTWTWTTLNGVNGYNIVGPNGNGIFLPATGYRYSTISASVGSFGLYWSSTISEFNFDCTYSLSFSPEGHFAFVCYDRVRGGSIRPILGVETIPVTTYDLTISATGNGYVSYSGNSFRKSTYTYTVNSGTSHNITITPDNGYRIKTLKKDGTTIISNYSSTYQYTISNISANTTVVVEFEAIPVTTYTLSISATGGGYVSYSGSSIRNSSRSFYVNAGSSPVITITPDNGYRIKTLKKNGSTVLSNHSGSYQYTVSNISANTTVAVEFEAIPVTTYTLSIKATGYGSASYNNTAVRNTTKSFTVNAGTSAAITFSPDNGYRIKSVKKNSTDVTSNVSSNKYTVSNIQSNTTIEVEFEAVPVTTYDLTISTIGGGYALYNAYSVRYATRTFIVNAKSSPVITIKPDNGYQIKALKRDGSTVLTNYSGSYQYTVSNITANTIVIVEFEAIPATTYSLTINASGTGFVTYEGYSVRNSTRTFTVYEGCSMTIAFVPDGNSRVKYLKVNDIVRTSDISDNKYTISSFSADTDIEVEFEPIPRQTYSLTITASGYGAVTYLNNTIRDGSQSFTLQEDESATILFTPEVGCYINHVMVNGTDRTLFIDNNQYIISSITSNTTVDVEFTGGTKAFAYQGINYNVLSYTDRTILLANGNYERLIEVPARFTYLGTEWTVVGTEAGALEGCDGLAAVIWHPNASFTASASNPNLLLYVNDATYAQTTISNVIANGTAQSIILTDAASGNKFYCPQRFVAQNVSYTHRYRMETGIDEARGWETLVLPFDVEKVTHESKGSAVPFVSWRSGDATRPFWLMQLDNSGWKEAESIKANRPYIISMPNNANYLDEFLLNGAVTFSAANATIDKTENLPTASYNGRTFIPNYAEIGMGDGAYALNVSNDIETNVSGASDGSRFVLNLRKIHPFEAYMTTSTRGTRSIDISDGMGIIDNNNDEERISVYNMKGMMMKTKTGDSMEEIRRSLPAGVYIINKRKVLVK